MLKILRVITLAIVNFAYVSIANSTNVTTNLTEPDFRLNRGKSDWLCRKLRDEDIEKHMKFAFVIFLHGDRTPSNKELSYLQEKDRKTVFYDKFYPFGTESLTQKGKQQMFELGERLKNRYEKLLTKEYVPEEVLVRSTDYARNKMSALLMLAGLYPPQCKNEIWNEENLKWQPIPYEYLPYEMDDLMFFRNCHHYLRLREESYGVHEVREKLKEHEELFKRMSSYTNKKITSPYDVYQVHQCMLGLKNLNLKVPDWYEKFEGKVQKIIQIEYDVLFRTTEMVKLSAGPMIAEIFDTLELIRSNDSSLAMRLYIVTAHEEDVMAWMTATKANITRKIPDYGAQYSIEISYVPKYKDYQVEAFYWQNAEAKEAEKLEIKNCLAFSKKNYCSIRGFKSVTAKYKMSYSDYQRECSK